MKHGFLILARAFFCLLFSELSVCCIAAESEGAASGDPEKTAVAVKIDGQISSPQTAILRRALRTAERSGADAVIIDMNTPGGDLASTLEIMEMLSHFKGETVCFINTDAISAGSFIAVACKKIIFSPRGVVGAAEAVNAGGGDVDESMKRKITSFVSAKVRSMSEGRERRAMVQRAMNDPNYELSIGGKILKPKGELLTLTAKEASELIDSAPLFSDGIADDIQGAAQLALGSKNVKIEKIAKTWADEAALLIAPFSPLIIGLGFFLVVMDLKSGGLGILSACALCLILAALIGVNLTGISGYEEIIVFIAGVALVAVEIFLFPGSFVFAGIGAVFVLGSLAWALGDVWPDRGAEAWILALANGFMKVSAGVAIAIGLVAAFGKMFNKSPLWRKMVLARGEGGALFAGNAPERKSGGVRMGAQGVCLSDLKPSGLADFSGEIVEVQSQFGEIGRGEPVVAVEKKDFILTVKRLEKKS